MPQAQHCQHEGQPAVAFQVFHHFINGAAVAGALASATTLPTSLAPAEWQNILTRRYSINVKAAPAITWSSPRTAA